MRRAEPIDGLEQNWREEKRLIDEKSINDRRTEAERATRRAETGLYLRGGGGSFAPPPCIILAPLTFLRFLKFIYY